MAVANEFDTPVSVERTTDMPSVAALTVMGWFYLDPDPDHPNAILDFFYFLNTNFSGDYIWLGTDNDRETLNLEVRGTTIQTGVGPSLAEETWYHFCYTKNGNDHKVYISDEASVLDVDEVISFTKATTVSPLSFYALADALCRITSFKIWTAVLSEAEIRAERDSLAAVRTANLHLNWELVDGVELLNTSIEPDVSGNNRDGVRDTGTPSTASGPAILSSGSGPDAPSDIAVDVSEYDQNTITWTDNSDDETGFVIQRRIVSGGAEFTTLDSLPANTEEYVDSDILAGEEYQYRVKAVNANGDSAYVTSAEIESKAYGSMIITGAGFLKGNHPSDFDIGKVRPNWGDQTYVLWARPAEYGTVVFGCWINNFTYNINHITDDNGYVGPLTETWDFSNTETSFVWFGLIDGYITLVIQDGRSLDRGRRRFVPSTGLHVGPADFTEHGEMRQRQVYTGPRIVIDKWTRVGFRVITTRDDDPQSQTYLDISTVVEFWVGCQVVYSSTFPTNFMNAEVIGYGGIDQGVPQQGQKVDFFVGGVPRWDLCDFANEEDVVPCAMYDIKQEPAPGVMSQECDCFDIQPQLWWKLRDVDDLNDWGYALYGSVAQETPHDAEINGIGFATGEGVPPNPCNATNNEPGERFIDEPEFETGTIIVRKIVEPEGDETEFDFTIDGGLVPASFSLGNGDEEEFLEVPVGTYEITEAAVEGYTTTVEVSNDSPLDAVTVAAGEVVIVTVTNKKNGTLIVAKVTNDGYTDLEFDIIVGGGLLPSTFTLKDGQEQVYEDISAADVYSVEEVPKEGWQVDIVVSNGSPANAIEISPGQETTVLIVNSRHSGFSGIYWLHPGKTNDTLWSDIIG